jgi:transcription termination factor Rho
MNEEPKDSPEPAEKETPPPPTHGRHGAGGEPREGRWGGRRHGRWSRPRAHSTEPPPETVNVEQLWELSPMELKTRALKLDVTIEVDDHLKGISQILKAHAARLKMQWIEGVLEINRTGHAFLRSQTSNYQILRDDPFVPPALIEQFGLRVGDQVSGLAQPPRDRERFFVLKHVDLLWNQPPGRLKGRKKFEELTALHPDKRLVLENGRDSLGMRALDILAPLGRGQRCLLVAPPRAGKTVLLQQMAESVGRNDPDVNVLVLLLDERPEEVGTMQRIVKGEVISSTFDEGPERHIRVAELVLEKSHRMVEIGRHVLVFLDSLTRMARAYNALAPAKGKVMSGGIESGALIKPRKFFSSARNVEEGGSLTIVGTILVETGNRMDDHIFEEFKGTGNMEVYLSRDLQELRVFPAIHIEKSGTRKEDILYHPDEYRRIQALRRQLLEHPPLEGMEELIKSLQVTTSNAELLMTLKFEK